MAKTASKAKKNSAFMKPMQPWSIWAKLSAQNRFREVRSRKRSGRNQEAQTAESTK